MKAPSKLALCVLFCLAVNAEIYFEENFPDNSWENEWTYSEHPGKEFGTFVHSSGSLYNDNEADKGIQTTQDLRYYALSKKFKPFSNEGKNLVIQFTVKHEQDIDCGGGYVKLFNCDLEPKEMHGDTPYEIMFGPDICGPSSRKVQVIFNYNGKNLMINKRIRWHEDVFTHIYTLIVKPDNTYEVLIDNEKVESGELEADWDFLLPKKIKDPEVKKPEDWDERPTIDDIDDEKPEDWDKPKYIPDSTATKPEDWDDKIDGDWEPALIDNPDFKGEWKPRQIDNPNYKGVWVHPEIDNPEYEQDDKLYLRKEICGIGFDLWQVQSGTIFNNILITNDIEEAKKKANAIWKPRFEGENNMKEAQDEEKRMKEELEAQLEEERMKEEQAAQLEEERMKEEQEAQFEEEKEQDEELDSKSEEAHYEL